MLSISTPAQATPAERSRVTPASGFAAWFLTTAMTIWGGCATEPQSFDTPDAAVSSLVDAMRASDTARVRTIVGSEGQDLLQSGDPIADANARAEFVRLFDEKNRLNRSDDTATLEVGNDAWPLPIPLVKGDKGWFFDTVAGADEVLNRRIGRNELDAIQVCLAIFDAQREYVSLDRDGNGLLEYAQQFRSDSGKRNGLYWPVNDGEPPSPLGELAASASAEGYTAQGASKGPRPYHGYYYRILTAQGPSAPGGSINYIAKGHMIGGFGVLAWPAEYGGSGLKSFMVSHHGIVYEKDLGDDTERLARAIKAFDPGEGWKPVATADQE